MKHSSFSRALLFALLAATSLVCVGPAGAATTTSTFTVNATITNSCTVTNAGNINLTQTTTTGTTTVSITCNSGTAWTAAFGGANDGAAGTSIPAHLMKNAGTDYIEYTLTGAGGGWTFSDPSNLLANDGGAPPTTYKASAAGTGTAQTATITATATTGAAPLSITTAPTGSYTDTVTVTVYF
jgi:spore coat protein U-like protein